MYDALAKLLLTATRVFPKFVPYILFHIDPEMKSEPIKKMLVAAAERRSVDLLEYAIQRNMALVNTQSEKGDTLLVIAIKNKKFDFASLLLAQSETDINRTNTSGGGHAPLICFGF